MGFNLAFNGLIFVVALR